MSGFSQKVLGDRQERFSRANADDYLRNSGGRFGGLISFGRWRSRNGAECCLLATDGLLPLRLGIRIFSNDTRFLMVFCIVSGVGVEIDGFFAFCLCYVES